MRLLPVTSLDKRRVKRSLTITNLHQTRQVVLITASWTLSSKLVQCTSRPTYVGERRRGVGSIASNAATGNGAGCKPLTQNNRQQRGGKYSSASNGRREYGKVEWFVPVLLTGDSGPNPVAAPNGMKPRKAAHQHSTQLFRPKWAEEQEDGQELKGQGYYG